MLSLEKLGAKSACVVVNPRDGALVFERSPGILEFYDLKRSRCLQELNVIGQNLVFSSFGKDHSNQLLSVKMITFNATGEWMLTVS